MCVMIRPTNEDLGGQSDRGRPDHEAEASVSLTLRQLGQLLIDLDLQDDEGIHLDQSHIGDALSWANEDYVYFELQLPRALQGSIDLSALGCKLFVRITR
jgi:hypothetical protein